MSVDLSIAAMRHQVRQQFPTARVVKLASGKYQAKRGAYLGAKRGGKLGSACKSEAAAWRSAVKGLVPF